MGRARAGGTMPHRQFTDSKHTMWEVWDVEPAHAERRTASTDPRSSRRTSGERRRVNDRARVRIKTGLAHGWLAFESKHDKRRLTPIPTGWEAFDPLALERLCDQAQSVGRPRRLLE